MFDINKQHIVIATTSIATGGLGSYLITLAEGLRTSGWDVNILVTSERGDTYDVIKQSMTCYDLSEIPLSWKKIINASALLNNISPNIILTNNCSLVHYCLPLLSPNIKPIAVLHSDDPRFYMVATLFSKRIFRWIAPTRKLSEQCKRYISADLYDRIRIIPHGVRSEIFFNKENHRIENQKATITFIGYIAENKGADLLPAIFENILKVHSNTTLNIVGYGPLKENIETVFIEKGIASHCNFTGKISAEKIAAILRSSDIFLLPTRIEGFGLTIIEAMISGAVPVITKLEGITDEIVKDGVTGILIEPNNIKKFSEVIIRLLNNRTNLKALSEAAISDASIRYSNKIMLDRYKRLFSEHDDRVNFQKTNMVGWLFESLAEMKRQGILKRVIANYINRILYASRINE